MHVAEARPADLISALDEASLNRFHLRAVVVSGMGFFTDAYDLFVIGIASTLIKVDWHLGTTRLALLNATMLGAAFIGAFVFGRIADLVRGKLVGLVFSTQALGLIVGPLVALSLLGAGTSPGMTWRLLLGFGALPALAVVYLRSRMPESPRFQAQVIGRSQQAISEMEVFSDGAVTATGRTALRHQMGLRAFLTSRRYLVMLAGTAGCWFLLDYAYYGNTISTPEIIKLISPNASVMTTIAIQLAIFVVAAVPGYILGIAKIDSIGHRKLQITGFLMMSLCFAVIGLVPGMTTMVLPFLLAYGVSYFFTEFGPNMTTFVLPGELFPVTKRATGHGISAGIGKFGAFVGVFLFPLLESGLGLRGTLLLTAGISVGGALLTLVLPEPAGRSLEDISGEPHEVTLAAEMVLAEADESPARPTAG